MIGYVIAAQLPELQANAESMMQSTCTIRRHTGVGTDPATGADVTTFDPNPVYVGKCQLKTNDTQVVVAESADSSVVVQQYTVKVPVGAGPFQVGDLVEVEGRRFRVEGLHTQTFQTAQRLPVKEQP